MFPISESYSKRSLSIPIFHKLTNGEQSKIINFINIFVKNTVDFKYFNEMTMQISRTNSLVELFFNRLNEVEDKKVFLKWLKPNKNYEFNWKK